MAVTRSGSGILGYSRFTEEDPENVSAWSNTSRDSSSSLDANDVFNNSLLDTSLPVLPNTEMTSPVDMSPSRVLWHWEMNYQEAAIFLEEGANNDKFTSHPRNQEALPAYLVVHNRWFYWLDLVASLFLLMLALVEQPAATMFQLPVGIHGSIELCLLVIMGIELGMKFRWLGWRPFIFHKRTMLKAGTLLIMVVEAIVVLVRQSSHFRVTRSLRPLFLVDNRYCGGVRRFLRQVLQSLPPILDMMGLLLVFILLFSLLGLYLFGGDPKNPYFTSLPEAFVSLFVLLTTANFPDVMMPAYARSRWSALFFVVYLCVTLYFLMNLLLAVVYETFTSFEKEKFHRLLLHKRKACQHAFRLLVSRQRPEHVVFHHFAGLLRHYMPKMSRRDVYLCFKALNTSQTGQLALQEFQNIYNVLVVRWTPKQIDDTPWFQNLPHRWSRVVRAIHRLVTWKPFDWIIYGIILGNAVALFLRTFEVSGITWSDHQTSWDAILFISLYSLEAVLKLVGLGPSIYFSSGWNVFDLGVTLGAVVGAMLEFFHLSSATLALLRPIRLLRFFKLKKRYRDVFGTLFILLPRMGAAAVVLLILYYSYAIVGMELFAGYEMKDCCINTTVEQFYKVDNSSLYQGYYYLNTFGDLITSFVTLFELTVVNNWFIIMDAYAAVTSQWSRLYFMSFYLVTMVVLTIIVAFVLETFVFRIQYKRTMGKAEEHRMLCVEIVLNQEELHVCYHNTSNVHLLQQFARDVQQLDGASYIGRRSRTKDVLLQRMYQKEISEWLRKAEEEESAGVTR